MDLEIVRTENGYHVKDTEANKEYCYESTANLCAYLAACLLPNVGDEVTIKD